MIADAMVDNSELELQLGADMDEATRMACVKLASLKSVVFCTAEELASRLETGEYTHRMFHALASHPKHSHPKQSLLQIVMPDEDKMRIVCEHACRTCAEPHVDLNLRVHEAAQNSTAREQGFGYYFPALHTYVSECYRRSRRMGMNESHCSWTQDGMQLLADYMNCIRTRRVRHSSKYAQSTVQAMNYFHWTLQNHNPGGRRAWISFFRRDLPRSKRFGAKARPLMAARLAANVLLKRQVELSFLDWAEDSNVYAPKVEDCKMQAPAGLRAAFEADAERKASDIRLA